MYTHRASTASVLKSLLGRLLRSPMRQLQMRLVSWLEIARCRRRALGSFVRHRVFVAWRSFSATANNRFERSRGRVFVEPRRGLMIGIKCLRLTLVKPRV